MAQPSLSAWADDAHPLRLVEQTVAKDDPDPKALACYGLLLRADATAAEQVWLRFVDGRPISAVTTAYLEWCGDRLAAQGTRVLVLVWDNAAWHVSREVRAWLRAHNQQVKRAGKGVRILACFLPIKSPWLNAIEPKWTHTKKQVVEPERLLSAQELADRVCNTLACPHEPHLPMPKKVA
ncbi:MAG: transposase [Chloroflexota bacterium]